MLEHGLFDLPSFVFDGVQALLNTILPVAISLGIWALLGAFLSMWVYGRFSNQEVLSTIKPLQKAASKRLAVYDGPFDGLMPLIKENLSLSGRHMWLTLFPALLASIPLLFILPWLSNTFGAFFPAPGTPVAITVESYTPYEMHWGSGQSFQQTGTGRWLLSWPEKGTSEVLLGRDNKPLVQLPPAAPSGILHKRQWWNYLLSNPAGYIEPRNSIETVYLDLPELQVQPWGPPWLRGWLPVFLLYLFAFSMLFKWRWRLQ